MRSGIITLVVTGAFIFLVTQLVLKAMGRPATLSKENPFDQLAIQTVIIDPLCLPIIAAAARYKVNWFYPAFMIVIGAHYLPFMFL